MALSRRDVLKLMLASGLTVAAARPAGARPMLKRPIPRSGETIPAVGLGTWQTFDVGAAEAQRAALREVLKQFVALGGSVVDSSPMYGASERVVGDLAAELGVHGKLFLATKVWTAGRAAGVRQMEESMRLLRTERIDLMQVHNLLDWRTHIETLREWKAAGRVRYLGITHYHSGDQRIDVELADLGQLAHHLRHAPQHRLERRHVDRRHVAERPEQARRARLLN